MEEVLNNGLNIIPRIRKGVREMISYFWQPSMASRNDYNVHQSNYKEPKREVDKREQLCLDNIMLLRIVQDDSYMVTMLGLKYSNCDQRILLSSGQRESAVIEKCLQDNLELERKSIKHYMPSDCIELYNEALQLGKYEYCLTILHGIEEHINELSREKNEIIKTLRIDKK